MARPSKGVNPIPSVFKKNEHVISQKNDDVVIDNHAPKKELKVDSTIEEVESIKRDKYVKPFKRKPTTIKMTFDMDLKLAQEIKKLSAKYHHGFKRQLLHNALWVEIEKLKGNKV